MQFACLASVCSRVLVRRCGKELLQDCPHCVDNMKGFEVKTSRRKKKAPQQQRNFSVLPFIGGKEAKAIRTLALPVTGSIRDETKTPSTLNVRLCRFPNIAPCSPPPLNPLPPTLFSPSHPSSRRTQQQPAAAIPSSAPGRVSKAPTNAATAAAAGGGGMVVGRAGVQPHGTPTRSSALLRPRASPYKDKSASAAGPSGVTDQAGQSPAIPGDRLSGQLARLSMAGAGGRREGPGGGAAARRETFQISRALSTTDSKMGLTVPTRPVLRRVSSAVLADEAAAGSNGGGGSGMLEQR